MACRSNGDSFKSHVGLEMSIRPKILFISPLAPTMSTSSGYYVYVKRRSSPILEKLSSVYDVRVFIWTKRFKQPISYKKMYLFDCIRIFINLAHTLLKNQFNVVVTPSIPILESIPAFIISKLLSIPIIMMETHWYWPNTLTSKLTWPINKLMCLKADLVICPGKKAYAYWRQLGVPKQKIKIIHFYSSLLKVNSEHIKLAKNLRSKFGGRIVILYFGRLIKKKGVEYLIKAFAMLQREFKDIVLVIAGEGAERPNLEKLCSELGLYNVVFTGAVEENIKPTYFLLADIYVYPSITLKLPEEWSLGVVEAMSVGKPVIVTTAVGSAPDVVKNGINGYVVPEKDVEALYSAIKRLIMHEDLRKNMGIMSGKLVEEAFTYEHVVKDLNEAIKSALTLSKRHKVLHLRDFS